MFFIYILHVGKKYIDYTLWYTQKVEYILTKHEESWISLSMHEV